MKAFVILVNGQRICSVGLTPDGNRSVHISWFGEPEGRVFLHAGGMEDRDHVDWDMHLPDLAVGDEVTVRVVDCDEADPPTRRRSMEEVDRWARNLRPGAGESDDEIPPLAAPQG